MRDPVRDIPRVLNVAMTIVIMSFVSVNMALYTIIPIEAMRDTTTPVVVRLSTELRLLAGLDVSLHIGLWHSSFWQGRRLDRLPRRCCLGPRIPKRKHLRHCQAFGCCEPEAVLSGHTCQPAFSAWRARVRLLHPEIVAIITCLSASGTEVRELDG